MTLVCKEVRDKPILVIINKCDLLENWSMDTLKEKIKTDSPIFISVKEQSGLDTHYRCHI